MSEDLLFDRTGKVAVITLNRPDKMNVFSVDMVQRWIAALEEVRRDPHIHVLVVTGAGRAFSVGGDLGAMAAGAGLIAGQGAEDSTPHGAKATLWELIQRVPLALEDIDKPVIAAVNGEAMGAGCDMALMCDLRYASERARFAESYVRVGLVPGDGGSYFLPRLVGVPKALELLWTGETIDAREAERIGLVNRVYPHDQLMPATMEMAERLARGPQMAIRLTKRAVYQGLTSSLRAAMDTISSHMVLAVQSEDFREGVRAMLERRAPVFGSRTAGTED